MAVTRQMCEEAVAQFINEFNAEKFHSMSPERQKETKGKLKSLADRKENRIKNMPWSLERDKQFDIGSAASTALQSTNPSTPDFQHMYHMYKAGSRNPSPMPKL